VAVNDDVVVEDPHVAAMNKENAKMTAAATANDTTAPSSDVTMTTLNALDNNNVVENNNTVTVVVEPVAVVPVLDTPEPPPATPIIEKVRKLSYKDGKCMFAYKAVYSIVIDNSLFGSVGLWLRLGLSCVWS